MAPMPGGQWSPPAPVAGAPVAAPPPKAPGRKRSSSSSSGAGRWLGCAIPTVIVGIVGLIVVSSLRSCDTSGVKDRIASSFDANPSLITLSGSATLLPGGADPEAVVVQQDSEGGTTTRRLARIAFRGGGSNLIWKSEPLDPNTYRAEIAVVGDTMFAASEDHLMALDAATGTTEWTATLHDKVTTGCDSCFAAVDGRLIVRTTDAYVTAYGPKSAESLWSKRLNATNGSISVVGDRLFVVDDPEDSSELTPVALVDPANGRTLHTTKPTCRSGEAGEWDVELSPGDPVRAVPGSDDVLAAFGFGDGCVVRWSPETGEEVWNTRLNGLSSFDQHDVVVGKSDVVVANSSGALVTMRMSDGTPQLLPVPADVRATPNLIVGRTLVADTATTRGTAKGGLIAWNLLTGERLWAQSSLGTAQPVSDDGHHNADALFDGAPRSLLVRTAAGVNVFVFEGSARTFTVAPLDLDTGDLGTKVRRAFATRYDSGTPSLTIEGTHGDQLVASVDQLIQAIPVSGKGEIATYPSKD
ncbi:PQQ-binding-like beta-propeller repeat protein [Aquihabitans sp. McL0605]|uniref:outer membrane protein assembly factor BamB family protein n=1 Tax=Aquihabitans sp. McL0605 TaxID=3415671 RepID=UPI003CED3B0C